MIRVEYYHYVLIPTKNPNLSKGLIVSILFYHSASLETSAGLITAY